MSSFGRKVSRGRGRGAPVIQSNPSHQIDVHNDEVHEQNNHKTLLVKDPNNHGYDENKIERMGRGSGRGNGIGSAPDRIRNDAPNVITKNKEMTTEVNGSINHDINSKGDEIDQDNDIVKAEELKEEERLQQLVNEMEEDMFETEEEREERLAQTRREERKQKLQQFKIRNNEEEDIPFAKRTKLEIGSEKRTMDAIMVKNDDQQDMGPSNESNEDSHQGDMQDNIEMKDDGNDSFDMFTSSVTPPIKESSMKNDGKEKVPVSIATTTGLGLDDAEGYYKASIGEIISFTKEDSQKMSFRVLGIIGKGVFSTVLKCIHLPTSSFVSPPPEAAQPPLPGATSMDQIVAMKLIRSNETMTKAAMKEVRILRLLQATSKNQRKKTNVRNREHFIVRMIEGDELGYNASSTNHSSPLELSPMGSMMLEYHNHTAILFEYFPYNLRETLSKFGKNVGINLSAVQSYSKQLLSALQHLADHRVVHADIKLDNILVSENFSVVQLCDFGSAFFETDTDNVPTPYLVSRFYRAPEVILGLEYDRAIDLWSVAVSLSELFCGSVMFPGRNNNDMLKRFMDCVGPFSTKMIRRHIASFTKLGLVPHFEPIVEGANNFHFRRQEVDKVTGMPVVRLVGANAGAIVSKQITQVLLKSRSASDSRGDVIKFADFLSKCLTLDPLKRISLETIMDHDFFKSKSNPM